MSSFHPFRDARRRRILATAPIADELWDWAMAEHPIFRWLPAADSLKLRELATVFLGEKRFDPVGGLVLNEATKVSIAAQAVLPLVGLQEGLDWYRDFSTIIVTANEYDVTKRDVDEAGVVHEYDDEFAGESFELGPVALSAADVEASGWGDGYNVVIHEMAHKLDARNGAYDGSPPLRPGMSAATWQAVFSAAFEDLRSRLNAPAARKGRRSGQGRKRAPRIDEYAAESPEEFFAVVCEYFYERPALLRSEYPEVYGQLSLFFGRSPAEGSPVEA
jgi:Mlc titration factor MtfA (ptsG expression regulator)